MKFKGDIIITDPCYIIRAKHHGTVPLAKDDWEACDYGRDMEVFNITTYLTDDTGCGDWSCKTINKDTEQVLGEFCADSGMVSVFLLDEVLKYNPDFDYHLNRPHTTTLIKDFDGDITIDYVSYQYSEDDNKTYESEEVRVIGIGNINFYTTGQYE